MFPEECTHEIVITDYGIGFCPECGKDLSKKQEIIDLSIYKGDWEKNGKERGLAHNQNLAHKWGLDAHK